MQTCSDPHVHSLESEKESRVFTFAHVFIYFETGFHNVGMVDMELDT